MPLVTTKEMLLRAQAGHYAVGAFNVENMEMVMAVVQAAEESLALASCSHPATVSTPVWINCTELDSVTTPSRTTSPSPAALTRKLPGRTRGCLPGQGENARCGRRQG